MKIGLVGYQGSGKSTLFHWLTEIEPDPSAAHTGQNAMATIQDDRIEHHIVVLADVGCVSFSWAEFFNRTAICRTYDYAISIEQPKCAKSI